MLRLSIWLIAWSSANHRGAESEKQGGEYRGPLHSTARSARPGPEWMRRTP